MNTIKFIQYTVSVKSSFQSYNNVSDSEFDSRLCGCENSNSFNTERRLTEN